MKVAIVAFSLLAVAIAADQIPILAQDSQVDFDGTFQHSFETGNGIRAQEQGVIKNAGNKDAETAEVQGSFQYTAPDGTPINLQYISNENGFQPQGAHLPVAPTPPPIPSAILKALDWIAAHPQPQQKL